MDMNILWQAPEVTLFAIYFIFHLWLVVHKQFFLTHPMWLIHKVLIGHEYTQKSDIHSLTMVLWEIIANSRSVKYVSKLNKSGNTTLSQKTILGPFENIPYFECKNQSEVREKVHIFIQYFVTHAHTILVYLLRLIIDCAWIPSHYSKSDLCVWAGEFRRSAEQQLNKPISVHIKSIAKEAIARPTARPRSIICRSSESRMGPRSGDATIHRFLRASTAPVLAEQCALHYPRDEISRRFGENSARKHQTPLE